MKNNVVKRVKTYQCHNYLDFYSMTISTMAFRFSLIFAYSITANAALITFSLSP
jgi:hypothetical protein